MNKETDEQKKLHAAAAQRANMQWARENALMECMARYKLTLPRNQAEWRVACGPKGEDIRGELVGILVGEVRVLCTDGLLAYFLLGDGETVVWGHLGNLVVRKEPRVAREGRPTKSQKPNGVEQALAFLDEQINKL